MINFLKNNTDIALLILRFGIGASFAINHGWSKIIGGAEKWEKIGSAMQIIGINFYPIFWGFMASFAEFFCAIFLIVGFNVKPSSFLLAFTMFIAAMKHISKGENASYPIEMFFVFIALMFIGGGKYSMDNKFLKK